MEDKGRRSQELRETIKEAYNLNELRGLAHDLDINFEQLSEGPLTTKVVSLIGHARHYGMIDQLEKLVQATQLAKAPADPDETPPYQGLNYFDVGDTDRYFSRDQLITDLINRINNEKLNFLMVVGASGSGKSSLVRAGLIPTLQGNRPDPTAKMNNECRKYVLGLDAG